jgi:hypothetical protein
MKVRAITIGQNIPFFSRNNEMEVSIEKNFPLYSEFNNELIEEFQKHDIVVETRRFCSQPIFSKNKQWKNGLDLNKDVDILKNQIDLLENECKKYDFDYFVCCEALADEIKSIENLEKTFTVDIPNLLKEKDNFFSSLQVASTKNGINLLALKNCAKIIKRLSEPDPFQNLKFCVSSNIEPDTPFFPSAYHASNKSIFSIALEMADEVVEVFKHSSTLTEARINLKKRFKEIYDLLISISEKITKNHSIEFKGVDFSPAPFPTYEQSIGSTIEELGFDYFGAHGSLIAVAIIKNCIPKEDKILGFSGFMQPVLEDYTIAKRLTENKFDLHSLLLYSTICGTGLDCVPLPGDITERELFYILLDVCTISITHDKPLTARLMPIPGKSPGDDVEFDFEYFASSKVMDIRRLSTNKKKDLFSRKNEQFFTLF